MMADCAVCRTRITTLREHKRAANGWPERPAVWVHLVEPAPDHDAAPATKAGRRRR